MLEIQLPTLLQITIKWKIACPLRLRYGMLREGETRYSSGTEQTKYTYTGQYSYTSDFGLHFYNARWYDSSLGRFAQADTIVPSGSQGLDRYAYVNNSPMNYIDPSGHMACQSNYCDPRWQKNIVPLSEAGQRLKDFSEKFGVSIENIVTAGLAGEASGWDDNSTIMENDEAAWANRYQWYADKFCDGFYTQNCELNFYMHYSESVRKLVDNNWNSTIEHVQLVTSPRYFGESEWAAGKLLYNASNANPLSYSFDPENNPEDRNLPFDVGIIPKPANVSIIEGTGYDQVLHVSPAPSYGENSFSVLLTYCQWQWWVNDHTVDGGCSSGNP
ncbi:MAG: RHS repeat-associated core domain-containing protein [Anaerolineales bacterium]|nr:RHS repeat-associated core domain-containing protein [Anaerolineales bacterium]